MVKMRTAGVGLVCAALLLSLPEIAPAQISDYQVIADSNSGTIRGTVKWDGPVPKALTFPVTKDPAICDPHSKKRVDMEKLIVGPQGGVANTVVFLEDIHRGKAMEKPQNTSLLNQKQCRYQPHIMLVPAKSDLQMMSSDATLHTIHMEGAATYNLPFPFPNQVSSRTMRTAGIVTLKCNGGHVWMNAEIFVIDHPYYAVTDESGEFQLTGVPAGVYTIQAWHEGWGVPGHQAAFDVLTGNKVDRPVFTEPRSWVEKVTVLANATATVRFTISGK